MAGIAAALDSVGFWVKAYAVVLSIVGGVKSTKSVRHWWRTRHLQRVWGIKDGSSVIVVCSELDNPQERQNVEPREFIYCLKYGDVDAYFEIVITLLRLYPHIRLRVMSAGELNAAPMDLAKHLIIIGGPDYNDLAERILNTGRTQFCYRSEHGSEISTQFPNEIVLYDKIRQTELCYEADTQDYGYFERIANPFNPDRRIVLIGGCHTTGVTGAARAFSVPLTDDGEIPQTVLRNARLVSKLIKRTQTFSVLVSAERVGQTISTPVVQATAVTIR